MPRFRAVLARSTVVLDAPDAATAQAQAAAMGMVRGIYLANPTTRRASPYGAQMGRMSDRLDATGRLIAQRVSIDQGGYDKGGVYWGLRPRGQHLYAVQDGHGNVAFVDASTSASAKQAACA